MCWRVRWPKQPAAFPQGWHVHYALTAGTAGDRGPFQPKTHSDSLSGTRLHAAAAPASPETVSEKYFQHGIEFPQHNFNRHLGCNVHETCRRPRKPSTYWPLVGSSSLPSLAAGKQNAQSCDIIEYIKKAYRLWSYRSAERKLQARPSCTGVRSILACSSGSDRDSK